MALRSTDRRGLLPVAAFGALVVLVGANVVAIRYSNRELAPLWGAGARFAIASVLFGSIVIVRRLPTAAWPPHSRVRSFYGLLGFAAFFACLYIGLVRASAGLGQIVVALVPLLTMLLAALQGLERLRWRALAGGLVALAGIAIVFGGETTTNVPLLSLLALLAAAISFAATGIIVKRSPRQIRLPRTRLRPRSVRPSSWHCRLSPASRARSPPRPTPGLPWPTS